ncbi:MAG: hypothetical protein QG606_282 [Patescibacteria group bacterium]|jgi:hypothetical protein|nr:hypothetical protein [Patescibacteria group bacterium]
MKENYILMGWGVVGLGWWLWLSWLGSSKRRHNSARNQQQVRDMADASQWFITTSCQPEVYDSQNSLITAFVVAFEQVMGTPVVQLLNLEVAIKSLPYKQTPRFLMFSEPLTVINCDASGESWNCIARGHTLMLVLYPNRGEDEGTSRYSEIEESGVLDRPKQLFFSVHHAEPPCVHRYGGFYQVVVLVPAVDSNDSLQDMAPVLLVVEVASRDEGPTTAEWDA